MSHQEKAVNFLLKATGNGYPSHQPSKNTDFDPDKICKRCGEVSIGGEFHYQQCKPKL